MRKNRLAAGALALAVSTMACGCSQMYELTDSEEAAVVNYAARAVTKFNLKQTEGINNVAVLEKQMEDEKLEAQKKEEEEKQQEQSKEEEKKPDTSDPAAENSGSSQQEQVQYVSLNQALKLGGVDAVYRSYEKASTYEETDSFMVTASEGNELLILHIDLKNNSNKKAACDILSKMPSFRLTVNNKVSMSADTTLLLNDFGTYQGEIQAGGRQGTVLIFQVKKGTIKKVETMELEVTAGGESAVVLLAGNA